MNKYRNKPTVVDGIRFASKKEAKRDAELQLLQRAHKIAKLKRQPRFTLSIQGNKICTYVADWSYDELDTALLGCGSVTVFGRKVVEDAKGFQTPEFKLKFKLAKALFPRISWRLS